MVSNWELPDGRARLTPVAPSSSIAMAPQAGSAGASGLREREQHLRRRVILDLDEDPARITGPREPRESKGWIPGVPSGIHRASIFVRATGWG